MKTLKAHQEYAINMMDLMGSLGIFYEPGTGKTAIALMWSLRALKRGEIDSVLVACPASLVGNWKLSIENLIDFDGISEDDVALLRERMFVTSYNMLYKVDKHVIHHRKPKKDGSMTSVKKTTVLRDTVDRLWGAVFLDESQCASAHDAKTTDVCLTIARLTRHRFPMTGTPVHGSTKVKGGRDFAKLYGQINFITPTWPTWESFCHDCVMSYNHWGKPYRYDDARCEQIMQEHSITVRLADCVDLPEYTETTIPCALKAKAVYRDLVDGKYDKYNLLMENVGGLGLKLLQVVSGSLKDDDGNVIVFDTSKDEALKTILDGTEDKVVIFCNFRASIDRCMKVCEDMGRKAIMYDGRADKDDWMQFQYGDADAIVCQYQAGSAGLDLYESHTLVFYEPTRSSLNLTQAKARIRRTGQRYEMRYLYLSTDGSLETKVWSSVREGMDISDEMLDRFARMGYS